MNPAPPEHRAQRLSVALECLFGSREEGVVRACREVRDDLRDIRDRRGVDATILTVLGHKNAGKSTLCRLLVDDPAVRERISAGIGSAAATRRVAWIGPEAPSRPDPAVETFLYCEAAAMADLGAPYLLADIPGYSDGDEAARRVAVRILRMASTAIVVLSLEMAEDEAGLLYLAHCDGARLLPVIVDDPGPDRVRDARFEAQCAAVRKRLAQACPASAVAAPVVIPKFDLLPPQARAGEAARARETVVTALRELLRETPADPDRLAANRYARFRRELAEGLAGFVARVGPRYDELVAREEEAAREIARRLQGSPAQFAAGVRLRLLSEAAAACPRLFFPYRTLLGLLALCAGAWDRLVLSGLGSLPSLAMVILQTGRNVRQLADARTGARAQLAQTATVLATESLAAEREGFLRSIDASLGGDPAAVFATPPVPPVFEGLETLERRLSERIDAGVRRWRASPWLINGFGLLATLGFAGLAAGPLWAVYHEFFAAWQGALEGAARWSAFPAPSAGMLLATLLLLLAPVLFLAMLALALVSGRRRVRRCLQSIDADGLTETLLRERVLRLRSRDEREAAVRVVLDECRAEAECLK